MEKTLENYIIEKLENAEKENQELKKELKNLCKSIQRFKDHFVMSSYDSATLNLSVDIRDDENNYIAATFNDRAEKLLELLNTLNGNYPYDD